MMCGGPSAARDADKEIQEICNLVRNELEQKSGKGKFSDYTALKYKSQVVAGSNYFVKIQVSPDECVHVRIFEPLPCNNDTNQRVFLHGYLTGKTVGDELDYFDQQQLS